MSNASTQDDLAIRAKPRPVKRFNKRALIGTAGIASLVIAGATAFALRAPQRAQAAAPTELYNTSRKPMPDAFNALPTNYAEVARVEAQKVPPRLGPALPGDLGAAVLGKPRAEQKRENPFRYQGGRGSASTQTDQHSHEARASKLFFIELRERRGALGGASTLQHASLEIAGDPYSALTADDVYSLQPNAHEPVNSQTRKEAFLEKSIDEEIYSPHRLQAPVSPYQIMAGTIIPASLITGVNSDLPGQVIAQVTENVYDSVTGEHLLIPQGTRMIGRYDSAIAYGQSRALMAWTRMIMPDGSSIVLDNLPVSDLSGYAGLKDRTDHHSWKLFQSAVLSSVLSVGSELGRETSDSDILDALRDGSQRTLNEAGQQIITKQLAVQPTITIRPGWRLRVVAQQDLILKPYEG